MRSSITSMQGLHPGLTLMSILKGSRSCQSTTPAFLQNTVISW